MLYRLLKRAICVKSNGQLSYIYEIYGYRAVVKFESSI